jgi:hypothetical protein
VAAEPDRDARIAAVDTALATWRQGDCVLGEQWFALRFDPKHPLSPAAHEVTSTGADLAEDSVLGFAVLTQTCDIVRSCQDRPFVEVCPLVEVDPARLADIKAGRRPAYALVPALAAKGFVADLERTMTVEKPVLAGWPRTPGCRSDYEARAFAEALARKRARFAFPDDFNELAHDLRNRIDSKHDRNSDEGRALRALREIRVQATPSWQAPQVSLVLWFIRHGDQPTFEGRNWDDLLDQWLRRIHPSGRFTSVTGAITTLDDLSAFAYTMSDRLDLDHLTAWGASRRCEAQE